MLKQLKLQPLALLVDACIVVNAYTLACLFLFAQQVRFNYDKALLVFLPLAVLLHLSINLRLGLYRTIGRYASLGQGIRLTESSLVSVPILLAVGYLTMPSSSFRYILALVPIGGLITFIMMAAIRFYPRYFHERSKMEIKYKLRLLIVGAGSAAEMVIRNIQNEPRSELEVVALTDDDPNLQDMEIHGIKITGPTTAIPKVARQEDVDEILIAIPSATLEDFQRILSICNQTDLPVKTIRPLQSTQFGKVGLGQIRDIEIEDVLGRQPVHTDYVEIREAIKGQTVLITGAGGSIGSELAWQISQHQPARMLLLDHDESALYRIHLKLRQSSLRKHDLIVADIKAEQKMEAIFGKYRPSLVFHAAAYKHVPLMELQPDEAVLNNVKGTEILARLAGTFGSACFVNISTDKAVEPVNVMGATKHLGERLIADLQRMYPNTRYRSVRFGNVLGTRGSVIPIFRQQILDSGPVTITHPDMTRYFMLISEAVDLVLQTATFPDQNVVYVLEMGSPIRIVDLARQMIQLMKPASKIDIVFIGLRPGEKLHERLFEKYEGQVATSHAMIRSVPRVAEPELPCLGEVDDLVEIAAAGDCDQVKKRLHSMIPSYEPFDMASVGNIDPEEGSAPVEDITRLPDNLGYSWVDDDTGTDGQATA